MAASRLSRGAAAIVDARVDTIFDRLQARLLGHAFTGKRLFVSMHPGNLTLPALFESAVNAEGGYVDRDLILGLAEVAKDYLDKGRAEAKAITKRNIQQLLQDVDAGRLKPENFRNAVESELISTWDRVRSNVERVVNTETQHAVTMGTKDALDQLNANLGIQDPVVAFLPVRDSSLCDECRETHLLPDGTTPRVFRSSEVETGYHVRGSGKPSWHLMHPHCRCALVSIFPGFGFDGNGRVTYIHEGFDEWQFQHDGGGPGGVGPRRHRAEKHEVEVGEPLVKVEAELDPWPENGGTHWKLRAFGGVMFNKAGHVLVRAPSGGFGGYAWTWPKGKMDHPKENPLHVAHREVLEETGHRGNVLGHLPDTFRSDSDATNNFWVMEHDGGAPSPTDWETQEVRWVHPTEAKKLLGSSPNRAGAKRDLAILDAAVKFYRKHKAR